MLLPQCGEVTAVEDSEFKTIGGDTIPDNVFKLIGTDWMLITAGNLKSYNTMTASGGAFGVLWKYKVCFCFIRPQRYTRTFMDRFEGFTLSFFDEDYRDAVTFCGSHSGRDVDKARETGLTPVGTGNLTWFREARMVMKCRKLYIQDIQPQGFLESSIGRNYPDSDYHRMYIGEITEVLVRKPRDHMS
jgi:flavin reductase (DIM6/NTAB) family NADH-FMN oxidoreductase RutF